MGQLFSSVEPNNNYLTKDDISSVISIIQEETQKGNYVLPQQLENYQLKGDYITSENVNQFINDIKGKTVWCADGKCRVVEPSLFPGYIKDKRIATYENKYNSNTNTTVAPNKPVCWKVDGANMLRLEKCEDGSRFSYDSFNKNIIHNDKCLTVPYYNTDTGSAGIINFSECKKLPNQEWNFDGNRITYLGPSHPAHYKSRDVWPGSHNFLPDSVNYKKNVDGSESKVNTTLARYHTNSDNSSRWALMD